MTTTLWIFAAHALLASSGLGLAGRVRILSDSGWSVPLAPMVVHMTLPFFIQGS
jgi:hypothetical protein